MDHISPCPGKAHFLAVEMCGRLNTRRISCINLLIPHESAYETRAVIRQQIVIVIKESDVLAGSCGQPRIRSSRTPNLLQRDVPKYDVIARDQSVWLECAVCSAILSHN